ncbi:hypothetical protein [Piscirickettsia litoralis]|uniref:Uncharacterized protein n=1 Tax=Piscirickettsia litoralis TaxID=1891921 RepID=A0ABX3A1P7_9GAMM|nr:hypothetical protein [Piscirickettsia litoralis]ODN42791.1 hypothetical protein BGC07_07485 [Piscirickettsia litoralis]
MTQTVRDESVNASAPGIMIARSPQMHLTKLSDPIRSHMYQLAYLLGVPSWEWVSEDEFMFSGRYKLGLTVPINKNMEPIKPEDKMQHDKQVVGTCYFVAKGITAASFYQKLQQSTKFQPENIPSWIPEYLKSHDPKVSRHDNLGSCHVIAAGQRKIPAVRLLTDAPDTRSLWEKIEGKLQEVTHSVVEGFNSTVTQAAHAWQAASIYLKEHKAQYVSLARTLVSGPSDFAYTRVYQHYSAPMMQSVIKWRNENIHLIESALDEISPSATLKVDFLKSKWGGGVNLGVGIAAKGFKHQTINFEVTANGTLIGKFDKKSGAAKSINLKTALESAEGKNFEKKFSMGLEKQLEHGFSNSAEYKVSSQPLKALELASAKELKLGQWTYSFESKLNDKGGVTVSLNGIYGLLTPKEEVVKYLLDKIHYGFKGQIGVELAVDVDAHLEPTALDALCKHIIGQLPTQIHTFKDSGHSIFSSLDTGEVVEGIILVSIGVLAVALTGGAAAALGAGTAATVVVGSESAGLFTGGAALAGAGSLAASNAAIA